MADVSPTGAKRRSIEERLSAAQATEQRALKRFEQKNAEVRKLDVQKKLRERKLDTRRKIIAGALVLEHMSHDAEFARAFRALLNKYVTRLPERALFGLPILDPETGLPMPDQPPALHRQPPTERG